MKTYTVTITKEVDAENKDEAYSKAYEDIKDGYFDHDSIEVEIVA